MKRTTRMSRLKDVYIAQLEEEMDLLEADGVPTERAYELAGLRAYDKLLSIMDDRADVLRQAIQDRKIDGFDDEEDDE
jgi:hypothetical protein